MFLLLNFFLLLLLLFQTTTSAQQNCSTIICSRNSDVPIRFPFRVKGKQPQNCSYHGFDLECNSLGLPSITLPHSGEFLVRNIDYSMQQIQLYDLGDCVPRRFLQFSLSESQFSGPFSQNYSFLSCPVGIASSSISSRIDCLSNSTSTVLATSDKSLVELMIGECTVMETVLIPVPQQYQGDLGGLEQDLVLSWNTPNCIACEISSGTCGPASGNSSEQVACFTTPNTSQISKGLLIFKIICLSVAIPAIFVASGVAVFMWWCSRNSSGSSSVHGNNNLAVAIPPNTEIAVGLDESTIESFGKVVLGESLRVVGPNNGMCSICLSEYRANEVLRCIPECKHCFHSDCIDEWLRMSITCPVCRNSPSPSHQHHSST